MELFVLLAICLLSIVVIIVDLLVMKEVLYKIKRIDIVEGEMFFIIKTVMGEKEYNKLIKKIKGREKKIENDYERPHRKP